MEKKLLSFNNAEFPWDTVSVSASWIEGGKAVKEDKILPSQSVVSVSASWIEGGKVGFSCLYSQPSTRFSIR